jgi:hypothetical protein
MSRLFLIILLQILFIPLSKTQRKATCHLDNPLCFYGTDILTYLQVLHQNQQYEKMIPFLTGPAVDEMERTDLLTWLSDLNWGYSFKRVGIRQLAEGKWSINYKRSRIPYDDTFKVICILEKGKCRLWLDEKTVTSLFPSD